jgi:uncharacterized protein YjbI with pentapeptide repeats
MLFSCSVLYRATLSRDLFGQFRKGRSRKFAAIHRLHWAVIHRKFIGVAIVTDVVGRRKRRGTGVKGVTKRTWRRGPQDRTSRSKAWTLREFGGKTVWDWLQLLIVPVILSLITVVFTWQQNARQEAIEDQRAHTERTIEEQRAQDAALQAYLDQMSQLMLERNLRGSEEGSEVRTLARARTRTVLARLDDRRKGSVVQFLYEASLLKKERLVVSLSHVRLRGADLSDLERMREANLSDADLSKADLSGVDLSDTDLREADLTDANLSFASMNGATMSGADLREADLSNAELIGSDLRGADLRGANMSGAILRNTDLSETYLSDATDLREAELSEADLRDARGVTEEHLGEQAKTLEGATMPDGSIHD